MTSVKELGKKKDDVKYIRHRLFVTQLTITSPHDGYLLLDDIILINNNGQCEQ